MKFKIDDKYFIDTFFIEQALSNSWVEIETHTHKDDIPVDVVYYDYSEEIQQIIIYRRYPELNFGWGKIIFDIL